ncbi:MAG TPA: enoyl-CoA hydratase [Casimicrobiaceae bacterium]|nr:enoyl-CoA hydratase [Casimicrobiaceae bacterium]
MNKRADATEVAQEAVLLKSVDKGVARLTMNRPRQFNAISMEMLEALQAALDEIAADAKIRVVVLAGNGPAFSGGHDLKEMLANRNEPFIADLFDRCSRVMLTMQALPQTVIARVHGVATAAGCQIVAACDLAVASSDARFATSGINYGVFCATPGVPVSRNVSRKRAFEMLFTGDFIDAATANDWGLVNRVVPPAELDDEVSRLAAAIVDKPRDVVAAGKALFYRQIEAPLAEAYQAASKAITCNLLGDDASEGVTAFLEKRKPRWQR